MPGVEAGHATVVVGVGDPVVDGERGSRGIDIVGHPAQEVALIVVEAHELDGSPVDRVAQVVVGAHIHTALPADGLADIGVAIGVLSHYRLETGVAAMS